MKQCKLNNTLECIDCGFCLCDSGKYDKYVKYLDDVESRATIAVYKPKEKSK